MKKLIAGNWKMNGGFEANAALLGGIAHGLTVPPGCEIAVCVPAPYFAQVQALKTSLPGLASIELGAQDVSAHAAGAYTGEMSAAMLRESGCRYAIVGHSERRQYHHESDALVADKAKAALAGGITPIVCIGETLDRTGGRTHRRSCETPAGGGHSRQWSLHQRDRDRLRTSLGYWHRQNRVTARSAGCSRRVARAVEGCYRSIVACQDFVRRQHERSECRVAARAAGH